MECVFHPLESCTLGSHFLVTEIIPLKCPVLTDIKSRSYGKTNHENSEIVL